MKMTRQGTILKTQNNIVRENKKASVPYVIGEPIMATGSRGAHVGVLYMGNTKKSKVCRVMSF